MFVKISPRRIALSLSSVAFVLCGAEFPAQAANADLVVRDLSIDPNPVKFAHELVIRFNVVNHGPSQAPASRARWTISGNPGMTFYCSVPALALNQAHQCSWTWQSTPNKTGTYGTWAEADVDRAVPEGAAGEANNRTKLDLKVIK
jgi:hypothetical protein